METCRTCAKCDFDNGTNWFDLFNSQRWKQETGHIHDQLSIWKIKISPNDGLPQKICSDCFSKFCTVSAFRSQCEEAQAKLSNIFDKIDTQSVEDDEVFEGFAKEQEDECNNSAPIVMQHLATANHSQNEASPCPAAVGVAVKVPAHATKTTRTTSATTNATHTATKAIAETEDAPAALHTILNENDIIEELIEEYDDIIEELDEVSATQDATTRDHDDKDDQLEEPISFAFECKYCYKPKNQPGQHYLTQQELLAHITEQHNSEQPFNCPYCKRGFQDAASRTTHLKDQHVEKVYTCETCGKKYADRFNLRNHVEKYHSDADFDCELCEKSFSSRKSLNYHMKWHDPSHQLQCSYCERLFINQRHLRCHEETHTGLRTQEICSFCGRSFIHLKTLRWHIYRQHGGEKPYKCGNCKEVFASYSEKRLHMLEFHLDNLTLIEKTECMLCHKRFENENDLKDHMTEDHQERKGAIKIANNKRVIINKRQKRFTGLFQCEVCEKRFNMKSALERHSAVHSTDGRPHACPQCPKRFKRAQDMNWHLKTHSNEKPNICDVCGKGFALKYVLTQHRRSHEVLEKNFTCTTCGRSYLFEKSLRLHERIHTGKTYYKCDLCNESFVTHIKFKWHMRKMHDAEDVSGNGLKEKTKELPLDDLVNIVIS